MNSYQENDDKYVELPRLFLSDIVMKYKLAYKLSQILNFAGFLLEFLRNSFRIPLSFASLMKWHMIFYFLNLNSRQENKAETIYKLAYKLENTRRKHKNLVCMDSYLLHCIPI